jgi:hypothetical protein
MSPHGAVIWGLAAATWVVMGGIGWLLWRFRRPPVPEVPCITDAEPPLDPEDPAELAAYVSERPAFDSAYAVEAGADGDEQ